MTLKEFKEHIAALDQRGLHDLTPVKIRYPGFFTGQNVEKIDVTQQGGVAITITVAPHE